MMDNMLEKNQMDSFSIAIIIMYRMPTAALILFITTDRRNIRDWNSPL